MNHKQFYRKKECPYRKKETKYNAIDECVSEDVMWCKRAMMQLAAFARQE